MIIGCTGNFRKKEFISILEKIHTNLLKEDIQIIISDDMKKNQDIQIPEDYTLLEFDQLADQADILFAIGGDGTILSTVRRLGKKQKPIMGIHIGGFGFLSECTESNLTDSINYILNDEFFLDILSKSNFSLQAQPMSKILTNEFGFVSSLFVTQ